MLHSAVLALGIMRLPTTQYGLRKAKTLIHETTRLLSISSSKCIHKDRQYGKQTISNKLEPSSEQHINKMLTIPNILTVSRMTLTPAIGYFIWTGMNSQALSCFCLAALTDLMDGFLARRMNQCSQIGAILDPVADKLLMITCFVSLFNVGLIPGWLVGGFVGRDVALLVGGTTIRLMSFKTNRLSLTEFVDFNKHPMPEFSPSFISKCNTALQCYLILLHLGMKDLIGFEFDESLMTRLHVITACTTAISFGQYLSRPMFSAKATP